MYVCMYVCMCSVAALRQLHVEELAAVKERHKRNEEFEKIASEMKYTSGSIKLMEEHVCMYVLCMYAPIVIVKRTVPKSDNASCL